MNKSSEAKVEGSLTTHFIKLGFRMVLAACIFSMLAGVTFSYWYWGYLFVRPSLPSGTDSIKEVLRIIPVKMSEEDKAKRHFVPYAANDMGSSIRRCVEGNYYCLEGRILVSLRSKGILPSQYSQTLAGLPDPAVLLEQSGLKIESEQGYDSERYIHGILVEGRDANRTSILFMALAGTEQSNDHYPYYEALFKGPSPETVRYVEGQRYFFDIAGIEGLEWWFMWIGLWGAITVGIVPVALIVLIGLELNKRKGRPNQAL